MEETEISVEFLMACALHPNTWFAWVPEEIISKIPLNQKVTISCTPDKVWIVADENQNIILSTEPTKILKTNESTDLNVFKLLFAKLTEDKPNDSDPPKVA